MTVKIHKLSVQNFRNLNNEVYEFSPGINCILGQNGNGKTNLLEAIYFLVTHKSFRKNTKFPQMISVDCEEPQIIFQSAFTKDDELLSYSGKIHPKKQEWFINSKPNRSKIFTCPVLINPFDAYQFYMSASQRRDFFDHYFSLLSLDYSKLLKENKKQLQMRNRLLSKPSSHTKTQILALDQNYSKNCFSLLNLRYQLAKEFNEIAPKVFLDIFGEDHQISLELDSRWTGLNADKIFNSLQSNLDLELMMGHTKYSIHKDDYTLLFNGFKAVEFCSLGQQKMSYLSLLFAYIELFRYKFKAFPLVMLDDLSGELDETRWKKLVAYLQLQDFQVLITSANVKFREELDCLSNAKNFVIESGSLVQ